MIRQCEHNSGDRTKGAPSDRRAVGWCVAAVLCAAVTTASLLIPSPVAAQERRGGAVSEVRPREVSPVPHVTITPAMVRYSNLRYALYFVDSLAGMLAVFLILRSGASARMRDVAEERFRNGLLRACVFVPLYLIAVRLLMLPLAWYGSYFLPHEYGLSTQTPGGWLLDVAKGFGVAAAIEAPLAALLVWTIRRSPRRWWALFWLALIPIEVVAVLLAPIILDPIYNRFTPMPESRLRDEILSLAARAGIERSRVYVMDASRRTRETNAYVTGIGGTARIVLWDTLLQQMDEEEVLAVMAHEMGHYVERHVPIGLLISILGSGFMLFLLDRGTRLLLAQRGDDWRLRGMDDLAALPALLLVLAVLQFFGGPVESAVSRIFESRADAFGLRLTHNGRAAASAFVKLSEQNLSLPSPPPFIEFWLFTHPPLQKRIDRALAWDLEHQELHH